MTKHQQRKKLKDLRRQLPDTEKRALDEKIVQQCLSYAPIHAAQRIGSYLSMPDEVNTQTLHNSLNKDWYVPRITDQSNGKMVFAKLGQNMRQNSLGILEPDPNSPSIRCQQLDLVLLPLLGFDRTGKRLGMGGGFYDRALAFKQTEQAVKKPLLVGLAYAFQELESIEAEVWDIPINVIITENGVITFDN
jgi:5-formyltetrahydrofolate cyclo-ligase